MSLDGAERLSVLAVPAAYEGPMVEDHLGCDLGRHGTGLSAEEPLERGG